jgi:hypothetical protein
MKIYEVMTGIIIKAILGLFIWLVLAQILNKQFKLKKNAKKFTNLACKIAGIAVVVFACIDFVKTIIEFSLI